MHVDKAREHGSAAPRDRECDGREQLIGTGLLGIVVAFRTGRLRLAEAELGHAIALNAAEAGLPRHLQDVRNAIEDEAKAAAARKRNALQGASVGPVS